MEEVIKRVQQKECSSCDDLCINKAEISFRTGMATWVNVLQNVLLQMQQEEERERERALRL